MTIGELAKRAGVGIQTIRFYERHGLVPQPRRLANGYRDYSADSVDRVRFIRAAKAVGFTLEEIAELLSLRVRRGDSCARVRERAKGKADEIDLKIAQLETMRRMLRRMIGACKGSRAIDDCAILGALDAVRR